MTEIYNITKTEIAVLREFIAGSFREIERDRMMKLLTSIESKHEPLIASQSQWNTMLSLLDTYRHQKDLLISMLEDGMITRIIIGVIKEMNND